VIGAGAALTAGTVTTGLRFLRYRAWRWALVGSDLAPLGRNGVMLVSVIAAPSLPEAIEPVCSQLAVPDGVVDVLMPEVRPQRPGIDAVVRELVASGVAQHVGMSFERQSSLRTGPLGAPPDRRRCPSYSTAAMPAQHGLPSR
jgi:hypothetical protein